MFYRDKKAFGALLKNELTGRMDVVWPQPEAPHYAVPNSWNFSRLLRTLETPTLSEILAETKTAVSVTVTSLAEQCHGTVIDWESELLVSPNSAKRLTSSTKAVIVWVPFGMA